MSTQIHHFIAGKLVPGRSGNFAPVFNPATGEQTGSVPLAGEAEMAEAVAAAKKVWPAWAATTPLRRARILNRFLRLLEENEQRIAATIIPEPISSDPWQSMENQPFPTLSVISDRSELSGIGITSGASGNTAGSGSRPGRTGRSGWHRDRRRPAVPASRRPWDACWCHRSA
jgi:hypothetical protein